MTKLSKPLKILVATTILLTFTIGYLFLPKLFSFIPLSITGIEKSFVRETFNFVFKCFIAFCCVFVVKKLLKRNIGISKKGFFFGTVILGSIMFVYCVFNFFVSFPFQYVGEQLNTEKSVKITLLYLLICLGVAIGEESVWRVLGVNLFLWAFDDNDDKRPHFLSVFIPSLIFGLAHLNNLSSTPDLVYNTISQVIYATIIGFYFSVVYVKSKNIFPCLIYHFLFDFANYVCLAFYPSGTSRQVTDGNFLTILSNFLAHLPLLIFSLLVLYDIFKYLIKNRQSKLLDGNSNNDIKSIQNTNDNTFIQNDENSTDNFKN